MRVRHGLPLWWDLAVLESVPRLWSMCHWPGPRRQPRQGPCWPASESSLSSFWYSFSYECYHRNEVPMMVYIETGFSPCFVSISERPTHSRSPCTSQRISSEEL